MKKADLHIHTPASRCFWGGDYNKVKNAILESDIELFGVCDHHSFYGFLELKEKDIDKIVCGIELTLKIDKCDEVFLLAFIEEKLVLEFYEKILNELKIPPSYRGSGAYVIERSFEDVLKILKEFNSKVICARIDKTEYRLSALDKVIESGIKNFDLVYPEKSKINFGKYDKDFNFFTFSDAHSVSEYGRRYSILDFEKI